MIGLVNRNPSLTPGMDHRQRQHAGENRRDDATGPVHLQSASGLAVWRCKDRTRARHPERPWLGRTVHILGNRRSIWPAPVTPQTEARLHVLDVLRGIALLGMFLVHFSDFATGGGRVDAVYQNIV